MLQRSLKEVVTSFGTVRVKAVVNEGKELLIPEFEDCKRIAIEKGLPLLEVYKTIERELGNSIQGRW
jgi:uncharacterized protein (DUF111 family)